MYSTIFLTKVYLVKTKKSYLLSQGIYSWWTLQFLDHHHQDCYPHGHQQLQTDPVGSETEVWKFKTIMWEFCSCTLLLARQCPSHFRVLPQREKREEEERSGERKHLVAGDANLPIMLHRCQSTSWNQWTSNQKHTCQLTTTNQNKL